MNIRHSAKILAAASILVLASLACNISSPTPAPVLDTNDLNTRVAGTFQAQLTISALSATPTRPASATPTETPIPPTPTDTATLPPATETPVLTATPSPLAASPTSAIKPTITQPASGGTPSGGGSSGVVTPATSSCYRARFVDDVNIPDGTEMDAGNSFTKTWKIQNTGTCEWSRDTQLVFVRGDSMGADDAVEIGIRVDPQETVNISIDLIAPASPGEHRGEWMFEATDGTRFGVGSSGRNTIWVEINVRSKKVGMVYSFVESYCAADWESDAGDLPCPGEEDDDDGFVIRLSNPDQENRKENEPALWTRPEDKKDGWIRGTFPPITIEKGDQFITDIGCLADSPNCDVTFKLHYRVNDGREKSLGEWHEVSDGLIKRIEIDLGDFAGKSVEFILIVETNGSPTDDNAFWLVPQIFSTR